MALSWDPFFKFWEGERYRVYKKETAQLDFQKSFVLLSLWLFVLGTCISVFLGDLLQIVSDEKFHSAASYAPLIILAYIFYAWGHYCDFGIFLKEKTRYMAYTEILSAAVILVLYIILIPDHGVLGAAIATALGYFFRFILLTAVSFRLYAMKLPWLRVFLMLALCSAATMLLQLDELSIFVAIPAKFLLLSCFFILIYLSPIIRNDEKNELKRTFHLFSEKIRNTYSRI
jgi:O-antigen/teichoic acid export membrane protein